MKGNDLICFGEPLFELSNVGPDQWVSGVGGDISNVAVASARQGVHSAVITKLGDDPLGTSIRDFWHSEGVDDTFVQTLPGTQTGLYLITHRDGEHHFEYRREGSAASRIKPGELADEAFKDVSIAHFSGISQAISASSRAATEEAIQNAKKYGAQISYDPNLRLKLWSLEQAQKVISDTLRYVDILLPGLDDARLLTGLTQPEEIIQHFRSRGPSIVALTMGQAGVLVSFGDEVRHIPSPRVSAVDASGAGDCFDGAFLSQLIQGRTVCDASLYAAAAAALSVQGHGAAKSIPRRDAVLRFQQPENRMR